MSRLDMVRGVHSGSFLTKIHANGSIFFSFLHFAVGIVLFTEVTFRRSWHSLDSFPLLTAGLSPINSTLTQISTPVSFWQYGVSSVFADTTQVIQVPQYARLTCVSYFCTGGMGVVEPIPQYWAENPQELVTEFVTIDAPGYQLDYYDYEPPSYTFGECQIYEFRNYNYSLQVCVTQDSVYNITASNEFFWFPS